MPPLPVSFNDALKKEYESLFAAAVVSEQGKRFAGPIIKTIVANKPRYQGVAERVGCPWWIVGIIHYIECHNDFSKHIHNGDPLAQKTKKRPANRPLTPGPWSWEESAYDALVNVRGLNKWKDWSIAGCLWQLEGYNGYGYRQYHPDVKTPYLWSMTNQYTKGKYIEVNQGGKWVVQWKPELVSQQLGLAAIMKLGFEQKVFS
ncbi:MAG: hypothetical protein EKK48_12195 [Candidatus Melainabacteria bacterium]|nr:MAG: hypothetical protein EKK48_12195 [Candidatus Melainabacteria bacterium]